MRIVELIGTGTLEPGESAQVTHCVMDDGTVVPVHEVPLEVWRASGMTLDTDNQLHPLDS